MDSRLERRLDEERIVMEQKRKERLEMHLYMKTCVSKQFDSLSSPQYAKTFCYL
jgi:hypothetical protein